MTKIEDIEESGSYVLNLLSITEKKSLTLLDNINCNCSSISSQPLSY